MNTTSHHCLYVDCFNKRSNKNVSFFKFPVKDVQRTAEWQKNCGNPNLILMDISDLSQKLICEKHFIPADININNKRKLLNKDAVPVKYVEPDPISVQDTILAYERKRKTPVNENTENSSEKDEETSAILLHSSEAVEECKGRWKNIRDTFMRRKRIKKYPPQKSRKWSLEGSLDFLNHIESKKATSSNIKKPEDTSNYNSEDESFTQTVDVKMEETFDTESESITMDEPTKELQAEKLNETEQQYQTESKIMDPILKMLEKNSEERQKLLTMERTGRDEHPIDIFFKSMAASVKQLTKTRQIRAKMQICEYVSQLELEEISSLTSVSTQYEYDTFKPILLSCTSDPEYSVTSFSNNQEDDIVTPNSTLT